LLAPGLDGRRTMSPYRRILTLLAVPCLALVACGRTAPRNLGAKAGVEPVGIAETTAILLSHSTSTAEPKVPLAPTASDERSDACPQGMTLVEGEYCPNVEQKCLHWLDPPGDRYEFFRCAEYQKPTTCKGARVHKRFCIDSAERVEDGSDLPMHDKSWTDATNICKEEGARLCMTSEWQFACEGEEMRPYPYGWARDSTACNVDVMTGLGRVGKLVDHRTPASAHPSCVSPFGVHDMAGNVDEWATVDGAPRGTREVMKGSWWLPGRHACRSFQGGHGAFYGGTETGVRCCKDATSPP
jgi:sulfatase modifying factor 1